MPLVPFDVSFAIARVPRCEIFRQASMGEFVVAMRFRTTLGIQSNSKGGKIRSARRFAERHCSRSPLDGEEAPVPQAKCSSLC